MKSEQATDVRLKTGVRLESNPVAWNEIAGVLPGIAEPVFRCNDLFSFPVGKPCSPPAETAVGDDVMRA